MIRNPFASGLFNTCDGCNVFWESYTSLHDYYENQLENNKLKKLFKINWFKFKNCFISTKLTDLNISAYFTKCTYLYVFLNIFHIYLLFHIFIEILEYMI